MAHNASVLTCRLSLRLRGASESSRIVVSGNSKHPKNDWLSSEGMNHDLSDWHPRTHLMNSNSTPSQSQSRSGGIIATALGDHLESDTIKLQEKKDQPPDLAVYHSGGLISEEKEKPGSKFMGGN